MKKYNFYKQNVDFSCCSKLIWIEAHVSDRIKIQQGNFDFYISKYRLFSRNSEMQTQTSEKKSGLQDINSQFWEEKSELRDINSEFKSRNPDYFSEFISCDLKKKISEFDFDFFPQYKFYSSQLQLFFLRILILYLAIQTFLLSILSVHLAILTIFSEFWIYILRFLLFFPQNKTP